MKDQPKNDTRSRVVIEKLLPEINCGQFPIKRIIGDQVRIEAHIFADGHDRISADLLYRYENTNKWQTVPLIHEVNDRWRACFEVTRLGTYYYSAKAWIDHYETWRQDLIKKHRAGQEISVEIKMGIEMISKASERAAPAQAKKLAAFQHELESTGDVYEAMLIAEDEQLGQLMRNHPQPWQAVTFPKELQVRVDRARAMYSTWYELFPRSCGDENTHGTFADCAKYLPEIQKLGFDVLYLPPIHPIGRTNRKGRNNNPKCTKDDPGSPWAIGAREGGHTAVHPALGTLEDFHSLIEEAGKQGIEIAMDIAFQCSPNHPWVREHPQWFRWRPDGTVQYAENPPKKYEDILPLNFETDDHQALWDELAAVVEYWIEQDIRIFRVDNPHTKSLDFWQWLIERIHNKWPDVIFLAEAFTRPKVMARLAKTGFSQSYTYFTWRNTRWELQEYIRQLTETDLGEYMRPNFWPNTPDILPEFLQYGGRAGFIIRLVLAATLSSSYGIYGPAFELCEGRALEGKEEYLDSEKYEIKNWDRDRRGNIRPVIERVNRIRRENESLRQIRNIRFLETDNEMLMAYAKVNTAGDNITVMIVNLDPHHKQSGWIQMPLEKLDIPDQRSYLMHDLIGGAKYIWQGEWNYVELDPLVLPAHILKVSRRMKRENDFDYFM